jgi:hypothetical protein
MAKRYLTLRPRVPASRRPYCSSIQHTYGSKKNKAKEELEFNKKLEEWKNL